MGVRDEVELRDEDAPPAQPPEGHAQTEAEQDHAGDVVLRERREDVRRDEDGQEVHLRRRLDTGDAEERARLPIRKAEAQRGHGEQTDGPQAEQHEPTGEGQALPLAPGQLGHAAYRRHDDEGQHGHAQEPHERFADDRHWRAVLAEEQAAGHPRQESDQGHGREARTSTLGGNAAKLTHGACSILNQRSAGSRTSVGGHPSPAQCRVTVIGEGRGSLGPRPYRRIQDVSRGRRRLVRCRRCGSPPVLRRTLFGRATGATS